jgi:hypothetical protein
MGTQPPPYEIWAGTGRDLLPGGQLTIVSECCFFEGEREAREGQLLQWQGARLVARSRFPEHPVLAGAILRADESAILCQTEQGDYTLLGR